MTSTAANARILNLFERFSETECGLAGLKGVNPPLDYYDPEKKKTSAPE